MIWLVRSGDDYPDDKRYTIEQAVNKETRPSSLCEGSFERLENSHEKLKALFVRLLEQMDENVIIETLGWQWNVHK